MLGERSELKSRLVVIADRAFSDAIKYKKIIEVLPEDQRNETELDVVAGELVFAEARAELKMGPVEMQYYLDILLKCLALPKQIQ